jgi:hypothetical protein
MKNRDKGETEEGMVKSGSLKCGRRRLNSIMISIALAVFRPIRLAASVLRSSEISGAEGGRPPFLSASGCLGFLRLSGWKNFIIPGFTN